MDGGLTDVRTSPEGDAATRSTADTFAPSDDGNGEPSDAGDDGAALDSSSTDGSNGTNEASAPYADSGVNLVPLFDGTTLSGWYYMDQGQTWSVVDGAIHGHGQTVGQIITEHDYGTFRLLVTSRMVPPVPGKCCAAHLGVLVWGKRPPPPQSLIGYFLDALEVQPPNGSMWDRQRNKDIAGMQIGPRPKHLYTDWTTCEFLFNLPKGSLRWASDGVEIMRYTDANPARWKAGPIGLVLNYTDATVEYKDIFVETDPQEDRLITVH